MCNDWKMCCILSEWIEHYLANFLTGFFNRFPLQMTARTSKRVRGKVSNISWCNSKLFYKTFPIIFATLQCARSALLVRVWDISAARTINWIGFCVRICVCDRSKNVCETNNYSKVCEKFVKCSFLFLHCLLNRWGFDIQYSSYLNLELTKLTRSGQYVHWQTL